MFGKTNHIHFVGIGGIGMSGMAELLHNLNFVISGSDAMQSDRTEHLTSLGIQIFNGHSANNVTGCDVLVYSSAVKLDNSEIIEAQRQNIPVIRRAEMLGELLKVKPISIGISGTHGKTTTSSMLGIILSEAQLNPTLVIGGIVNDIQSNSLSGSGDIIVVEADEFDRTFLSLQATMVAITSLELEHLDCYENMTDLQTAFSQFANTVPFYGKVVVCIDEKNVQNIIPNIKRPMTSYGFSSQADFHIRNDKSKDNMVEFEIYHRDNIFNIRLNVPGIHNIKNATAAFALAYELEIDPKLIIQGLEKYSGVRRRFEIKNESSNNILFVDDYAHHPSEVEATLQAAKSGWNRRVISIFQPHLFTRTRDFHQDFARAFLQSDILIVTSIYPAREKQIEGVTGEMIVNDAQTFGHKNVYYVENNEKMSELIKLISKPGDMIITMGAGDIWKQNDILFKEVNA
jgi:UDP-N-acetylmuramate--alanine ligase